MKSKKCPLNKDFPFIIQDIEEILYDNQLENFKIFLSEINNKLGASMKNQEDYKCKEQLHITIK